jgi:hypothetical protein
VDLEDRPEHAGSGSAPARDLEEAADDRVEVRVLAVQRLVEELLDRRRRAHRTHVDEQPRRVGACDVIDGRDVVPAQIGQPVHDQVVPPAERSRKRELDPARWPVPQTEQPRGTAVRDHATGGQHAGHVVATGRRRHRRHPIHPGMHPHESAGLRAVLRLSDGEA